MVMSKHKDDQLAKKDLIMDKKDAQLVEDRRHILSLVESNQKLITKIVEDAPKIAIIPDDAGRKHELRVYRNNNDRYKFIRAQKRYVNKAVKKIPDDYSLVLKRENIANAMSPLNRVKEMIPRREYTARNNEIETRHDVINLLENILSSSPPPPYREAAVCRRF